MAKTDPQDLSLVADVGGTNTRVALSRAGRVEPDSIQRFENARFQSLHEVLQRYLSERESAACGALCVAVAGPVRDGHAEMTNLDWAMDEAGLAAATGAEKSILLNDLQAQGHAIAHLPPEALSEVLPGPAAIAPGQSALVVGVGTGFNAAPVHYAGGATIVPPCECGHAALPIRSDAEVRLARFAGQKAGFPETESVLSGRGLENVYRWLGHEDGSDAVANSRDIMAGLADSSDARAVEAGRFFVQTLGAVCGNLALIQLPFGGVYLIGGLARAFSPYFERFGFAEAFRSKGRFSAFMDNFPVRLVQDDYAALAGCAAHLDHQSAA